MKFLSNPITALSKYQNRNYQSNTLPYYSILFSMATKKIVLLFIASIILAASAEVNPCKVCAKLNQCPQQLLSDANIDPIYNSIAKQLSISDYPNTISKKQNEKQIVYVFTWPSKTYQATVDLVTRSFKVVDQSPSNPLENLQLSLGLRKTDIFGNQAELITRIDQDIKNKYFSSQKVLCLAVTPSYNGFQAIYQKEDFTVVVFDVAVKTEGGNTQISYQINNSALASADKRSISYQNVPVNTAYSTSSSATIIQPYLVKNQEQLQVQNSQSISTTSQTLIAPHQVKPAFSTGGYSQISLKGESVLKIFNFLVGSIGQILKYGTILKCERQTINGFNYRFTVSFDTQSTLQYVIVAYETIDGQYSISSIDFANQRKEYTFSKSITSQQASKMAYLPSLVKNVMAQLADVLTTDSILVAVYKDFPFFKFVYNNKQYQEIGLIVQYQILKNVINVVDRKVIKRALQKPIEPVLPHTIVQPPKTGGYQIVSSNDQQLQTIFTFLIGSVGQIFKSATLIQAQRQVVNGFNYRLTVSFDGQSSSKYVLVIYQSIDGELSFQSADLVGYSQTFNFANTLSNEEISKISYLSSLSSLIVKQFSTIITSDTIIDSIAKDFPYFQFSYHNNAYKTITIVVLYDVIRNSISVINQTAVPQPKVEPLPQPQPEPQPLPQPSPTISSNLQNLCGADYELAGQSIRQQTFVSDYLNYIFNIDSRCTRQVLVGIFWKKDDKNFLKFIFQFSDGSIREFKGSCDYIQYTLRTTKVKSTKVVIPNCLSQTGNTCNKCAFKYYLNNGNCLPVQLQCSDFNYETNNCEGCYTGYYLDIQRACQKTNYLCSTSDRKGFCLTCFNNYRLTTKGTCVYKAEGASERLSEQQDNPLCSKFNQLKCLECVKGCYMNQKGLCKIPDPNCLTFDQRSEVCLVCVDNYFISQSTGTCIPNPNYN